MTLLKPASCSTLMSHFFRTEFAAKERLLTPLFFAAVILLLFAFAIPESSPELRNRMFVAQCLISAFFAVQLVLSRAFEAESTDRTFDMIRTTPVPAASFILAKLLHITLISGITLIFTATGAVILQGQSTDLVFDPIVWGIGTLMLIGLAGLGVLLSAITLRSQARQILFPLLYFPLCTPVLIVVTESLCQWYEKPVWDESMRGWITVLIAFDVIYVTLTILLGADAISTD